MTTYIDIEKQYANGLLDVYTSAQLDKKDLAGLGLKLAEEFGELAEQINVALGNLPNKVLKEPFMGEVADVYNCLMCIMFKAHPELNYFEVMNCFNETLEAKNIKWRASLS